MTYIDRFLNTVCSFVSTEERAKEIREELMTHIEESTKDYEEIGYDSNEATIKTLQNLGDPHLLSKAYKEKLPSYRVYYALILGTAILIWCGFSSYEALTRQSPIFLIFLDLLVLLCYGPILYTLMDTHKKHLIKKTQPPLFYIQHYKAPHFEHWLMQKITFFIGFIVFFNVIILALDFFNDQQTLLALGSDFALLVLPFLIIFLLFNAQTTSSNHNVVYEDGIMTFMKFVPWDTISKYRWNTFTYKGTTYYALQIKTHSKKAFTYNAQALGVIKVSQYQKRFIEELMTTHHIPYSRYM